MCPQFSRKTFERRDRKINFSVKNALFSTKSYFRGTRFLLLDFTFKDVTRLKKVISLSNFTAVPRVCTIVCIDYSLKLGFDSLLSRLIVEIFLGKMFRVLHRAIYLH